MSSIPLPASTPRAMGQSHPHESAQAQVAGAAHYIDDLPEVKGTLYAAPILSTVAHGRLNSLDTAPALAMPGVRAVVLTQDIPGDPVLAAFAHDEPIFATGTVHHVGQVMGLVVAGVLGSLWLRPLMALGYGAINLLLTPLTALLR